MFVGIFLDAFNFVFGGLAVVTAVLVVLAPLMFVKFPLLTRGEE